MNLRLLKEIQTLFLARPRTMNPRNPVKHETVSYRVRSGETGVAGRAEKQTLTQSGIGINASDPFLQA